MKCKLAAVMLSVFMVFSLVGISPIHAAPILKLDQAAPAAPVAGTITATAVTLDTITGAEYRNGTGEWQPSPAFTDLSPNTEYTFYARLAETETHFPSPPSTGTTVSTDRLAAPATPAAPTLSSKTVYSVTLVTVVGAEYRMGTGEWQSSPLFSDLSSNTEYTFYTRVAETATTYASLVSSGLVVSTYPKSTPTPPPSPPTVASKTATSVTLDTVYEYEYRIGTGDWQSSPLFTNLLPDTVYVFSMRAAESLGYLASVASESISVTTDPAPVVPDTGEGQITIPIFGLLAWMVLLVTIRLRRFWEKSV